MELAKSLLGEVRIRKLEKKIHAVKKNHRKRSKIN